MSIAPLPGFAEPFSSLSHLLGAIICCVLSLRLCRQTQPRSVERFGLVVFSFTCIFLLLMSGTFHLLPLHGSGRVVVQRLDHAAIFMLIAGTFTPIHILLFDGILRWVPIALIWIIAITALTLKTIYFTHIPEFASVLAYLAMGWLGGISCLLIWRRFGLQFIRLLLLGSFAYTAGAIIELVGTPLSIPSIVGSHEIFHVAVLFGIYWHWSFVQMLLVRKRTLESTTSDLPGTAEVCPSNARASSSI